MSTFNSDEEAYANESFECDSDEINDSPAPNIANRESLQLKVKEYESDCIKNYQFEIL